MYKIYADDFLIYDDTSPDSYLKVTSPKLSLAENSAGSLTMTIPPGNAGYDMIVRMVTNITVEKDGEYFWAGRVLQEKKDFWNNRNLTCEGELAFLNDTTQPQDSRRYPGGPGGMRTLLLALLAEHNDHALPDRRIYVNLPDGTASGIVTAELPSGGIDFVRNYEKTIECVNKLSEEYSGAARIRRVVKGGATYRVLDFLKVERPEDRLDTNTQTVEFGKNLIEFSSSFDSSEYATVIVPLGEKLKSEEGEGVEGLERYVTVETDPRSGGTRYVKAAQEVIDERGWIEKVVHFDDISTPSLLYNKAMQYLTDLQFETMQIDLSALDLHYLNPEIEDIRIGDLIQVVSVPHGIHHFFPVKKLDIPLDQPQNATYQLGDNVKSSMTAVNNKLNSEILEKLEKTPDINEDAILKAAQDNASALMNQHLNGYVTITTDENGSNELYIAESRPLMDGEGKIIPKRFWKWGLSGLGYTDDGGVTWKTAMTMDGSIIGDRIAAGSIHGSKITAGSLELVTTTGGDVDKYLSIGLTTRGLAPRSFEVGDIDGNDGKNIEDETRGRTVWKSFLKNGTVVKITNSAYKNKAFIYKYTDANEAESGFVSGYAYGINWDETENVGKYTVTSDGYYRFVLYSSSSSVTDTELETMAQSIQFSGGAATITAAQLNVIGMVRFYDLGKNGTTEIDGARIKTGQIDADRINLKGITVTTGSGSSAKTTFKINDDGTVYVDGTMKLSESSTISFSDQNDKTLGQLNTEATTAKDTADEASNNVTKLANGQYAGGSFISNKIIFGPTIIGNELIAQAEAGSDATSGSFILRTGDAATTECLRIRYTNAVDGSPGIFFTTVSPNQYHFDAGIEARQFSDNVSGSGRNSFYGETTIYDGGTLKFSSNDSGIGGKLILGYGTTYVANYASLPANPQPGQICFVLN